MREKSAIPHAAASLLLFLSFAMRVVVRAHVHVGLCVYVRDRYAIARAPTESMKIKREYSSPSEVKDALECRIASRLDTLQRNDAMMFFRHPLVC